MTTAMTLTELRYAVALMDTGHFGRAAERCHVSQPTLSTQIKKLEQSLGLQLFERGTRQVRPTAAGQEILAQAQRVVAEAARLEEMAASGADPLAGPLRLGVIPTLGPYLLPWLIEPLKARCPALKLVVHENLTEVLLEALADHRLDAALLALPVAGDYAIRPLFEEPFLFLCAEGHPLASRRILDPRALADEPLLLLTEGHCLRDQALAYCGEGPGQAGQDADFRATSLETLRQMVAGGMGATLLPALAAEGRKDPGTLTRPLSGSGGQRCIALVSRPGFSRPQALEALAKSVRESAPEVVRLCDS